MTTERADQDLDPRQALKDELWGMGVPDAAAEELLAAWEAHAVEAGIPRDDPAYWALGATWIDQARGAS